jgi:acyl-CoA synthetase (NDP forming)
VTVTAKAPDAAIAARRRSADIFHHPRSVAVIGASENIDKVGGRPILYLRTLGYAGAIYPINPTRSQVQGLTAYPDIPSLPEVPDVAVIAVGGPAAVDAVAACAAAGVQACVIMAAGFSETSDPEGHRRQDEMVRVARAAGMRLAGPNAHGIADFGSGAVLSFNTMFIEAPPKDGPVALISQSGGMSSIPYGLLRERGIGVRYVHGTGNDCDVSVAEFLTAVVQDPDIKVACVYLEGIADPAALEHAARTALAHDVPVVALIGGRSENGARAAQSHTGSLASGAAVVDTFLDRLGIRRVGSMTELVEAVDLYLSGAPVTGARLAIISNSGGSCVLSSDYAAEFALPLATWTPNTLADVTDALPPFASPRNPVDITGKLLHDSKLVRRLLDVIPADSGADAFLISLPVSGRGYDVDEFVSAVADFNDRIDRPLAFVTPQPGPAALYRARGLPVYADEAAGTRALAGYIRHRQLIERVATTAPLDLRRPTAGSTVVLNEPDSLAVLGGGADVVTHILVGDPPAAADAFAALGGGPVVVKGCTSSVSHKSDFELVELGCATADETAAAAGRVLARMSEHGFAADGVLVEQMVDGALEVMVGAHRDPTLGAVVIVGGGGKYVEAVPDFAMLLPPFSREDVARAIDGLRLAPLLTGVRGERPLDATAWIDLAMAVGELMVEPSSTIESLDANPVLLVHAGDGTRAVVADAVVVRGSAR